MRGSPRKVGLLRGEGTWCSILYQDASVRHPHLSAMQCVGFMKREAERVALVRVSKREGCSGCSTPFGRSVCVCVCVCVFVCLCVCWVK